MPLEFVHAFNQANYNAWPYHLILACSGPGDASACCYDGCFSHTGSSLCQA